MLVPRPFRTIHGSFQTVNGPWKGNRNGQCILKLHFCQPFYMSEKELLSISGPMDFNPVACTKIAPISESLWLEYFHTLAEDVWRVRSWCMRCVHVLSLDICGGGMIISLIRGKLIPANLFVDLWANRIYL